MSIKVLLVDDHLMVLKGLRFFLSTQSDIHITGEAHNGGEALDMIEQLKPDIVLMDLAMPELNGIEATRRITSEHPGVKVIILTSFSDQDHVLPALKAGASGYQLKDIEPEDLAETIRMVFKGETMLHQEATNLLLSQFNSNNKNVENSAAKFHSLTQRECDVLKQITLGKGNKEIAKALVITEKTVKTHVSNILGKLELHDRTQAAIYAMKHSWFE